MDKVVGAPPSDGRSRSGKARMDSLTPDERSELARRAAQVRWKDDSELKVATHAGEIQLAEGRITLPCAVLADGTRVLTERGFLAAIGRTGNPKNTIQSGDKVPPFLKAQNLAPFVSDDLRKASEPIPFRTQAGQRAWGYRADILPRVCEVYLQARDEGDLATNQVPIAVMCDILLRGVARVGIVALVDEATGYQRDRARDALALILTAFIATELRPWVKTFPSDYYENLFRLRGLDFPCDHVKRPQYFGTLTNDIVYSRLAPGVLDELKRVVPRNQSGRPTAKYFQKLTANHGYRKLIEHLGAVTALMKVSTSYQEFHELLDRHYPKHLGQLVLPYEPSEDTGQGI